MARTARLRRVVWAEAVTLQRGLPESAMGLNLLAQVGVVTRPAEDVQQPAEEHAHAHQALRPAASTR